MHTFTGICIITHDVARLRAFYRTVLQTDAEGDDTFATFALPNVQLSLCSHQIMEQMAPGSMVGAGAGNYALEFAVDDVDAEFERLSALKIPIVKPPTTQPWGLRSVWLRDPDGNVVNYYANVDVLSR